MKIIFSLFLLIFIFSCKEQKMKDGCPDNLVAVCGQPKMPICPAGQVCPMVMPVPKTYQNMCFLNKAGSKFISNGACSIY